MKLPFQKLLALVVLLPGGACLAQPVFTSEPLDQSISLGANVTFRVTATGGPLTYQWTFNETNLPAANASMFNLVNTTMAHAGRYAAIVTNPSGSVTSQVARLEIDATFTKITTGPVVAERTANYTCAWADYDDDGLLDLVIGIGNLTPQFFTPLRVFRNNGSGSSGLAFTKITTGTLATLNVSAAGMAWGDYDNDGRLDVYLANFGPRNILFRNTGNGAFVTSTDPGIANNHGYGDNAGWADYNRDGYLDLFATTYDGSSVKPNLLYRNNGNATFTRLTAEFSGSFLDETGLMATVAWGDYDNDGDPDLYITNDRFGAGRLVRNNGDGTFRRMPPAEVGGITDDSIADSSSGWWGDFDNDGDLDMFVSVGDTREPQASNLLWRNNGNGTFDPTTVDNVGAIVGDPGISRSAAWADYDNDGWLDIYVTNPGVHAQGADNYLYRNQGDGTFVKVTTGSLVHDGGSSWGSAWGDFDNDGFMDLVVANGYNPSGTPTANNFLFRNNGNTNHWLKLKLRGTASNRSAVGAKVRVKTTTGGKTFWQMREISGSSGRYAFQDIRPNFGLGEATSVEIVRIEWPSGLVQELRNVNANQLLTITEPPRLLGASRGPEAAVALRVRCWDGFAFDVEASSNLTDWVSLGVQTVTSGTLLVQDELGVQDSKRFYRLRVQ